MSDFRPLDMQRTIRDDGDLRGSEKGLLWAAVLRTDNKTRKVKASLELLAKDAGLDRKTASRAFRKDNGAVMGYFEKIERCRRGVNLWFKPTVEWDTESHSDDKKVREWDTESHSDRSLDDVWARAEAASGTESRTEWDMKSHSVGHRVPPSASLCSSSASSLVRPSDFHAFGPTGDEEALDTATPAGPLSEEPASQQGQATEQQGDEGKPCGCPPAMSCPTCRDDVVRSSKHSPAKLKEFRDRELRDEGLNQHGEPLGLDY